MRPSNQQPLLVLGLVLVLVLGLAVSASATEYTWTGGTTGNWSDSNNWNSGAGGYPNASTDEFLFLSGSATTITVDGAYDIGTISKSSSPRLVLQSSTGAERLKLYGDINNTGTLQWSGNAVGKDLQVTQYNHVTVNGGTFDLRNNANFEWGVSGHSYDLTIAPGTYARIESTMKFQGRDFVINGTLYDGNPYTFYNNSGSSDVIVGSTGKYIWGWNHSWVPAYTTNPKLQVYGGGQIAAIRPLPWRNEVILQGAGEAWFQYLGGYSPAGVYLTNTLSQASGQATNLRFDKDANALTINVEARRNVDLVDYGSVQVRLTGDGGGSLNAALAYDTAASTAYNLYLQNAGNTLTVDRTHPGDTYLGKLVGGGTGASSDLTLQGDLSASGATVTFSLTDDAVNYDGTITLDRGTGDDTVKLTMSSTSQFGDASLAGNGVVEIGGGTGELTMNGTVSPGLSAGTIQVAGSFTFAAGSTYLWEPGDLLDVSGVLDSTGAWTLDGNGSSIAQGFTIATAGGVTDAVTNNATVVNFTGRDAFLQIVGNDLVLGVVPEPSTALLLGVGALVTWYMRRVRRA